MAATDAPADSAPPPQRYIHVLRLVERLHREEAWTQADKDAVSRHFLYLKEATARGQVLLVGRTQEPYERTFGIAIFEAADASAAQRFSHNDPAVIAGVMTCECRPFTVILERAR